MIVRQSLAIFRIAARSAPPRNIDLTTAATRKRQHISFTSFSTLQRSASRPRINWQGSYRRAQQQRCSYRRKTYRYQQFASAKGLLLRWAARPTFLFEVTGIAGLTAAFYIYNLEEVPMSGRKRFNWVPTSVEKWVGRQEYKEMLQKCREYLLPVNSEEHLMVQRVLERLIPHSGLESEEWKVHVIADGQVNAFVIPGGKVFVQTGMLGICKGDDELAAVLGHEIAHNVAHHVGESISKSFGWILLACGISFAANIDLQIGRLLAKYIFELPNSRAQESEADFIGLMIMAQSCYPPEAAIRLWGRMKEEEQNSGRATPEFFSTHPSDHSRILRLQEWLPEAQQKLHDSECAPLEIHAWNFRQAQLDFPRW